MGGMEDTSTIRSISISHTVIYDMNDSVRLLENHEVLVLIGFVLFHVSHRYVLTGNFTGLIFAEPRLLVEKFFIFASNKTVHGLGKFGLSK